MGYRDEGHVCSRCFEWLNPLCRIWGIASAVATIGVGADVIFHRHYLGVYILVVGFLLFFLETTWIVSLFLNICLSDDGSWCIRYWDYVRRFDGWKKGLLYIALATIMFMEPRSIWLAVISGTMMVVLALLYLLSSYKIAVETKETLLSPNEEQPYDRFEDIPDDYDDTLPEPTGILMNEDTVANQDAILQV
ncbi:hypothetical protein CHUAL_012337 [Chamberlinius hualienensis]